MTMKRRRAKAKDCNDKHHGKYCDEDHDGPPKCSWTHFGKGLVCRVSQGGFLLHGNF